MEGLVALTGAFGFIGSATARAFREAGYDVCRLGRTAARAEEGMKDYLLDIASERQRLRELFLSHRPDLVVHLAFEWPDADHEWEQIRRNLEATGNVLDACAGLPAPARFVLVSSCAVYGQPTAPDGVGEDCPIRPVTRYGAQKAFAEALLSERAATLGIHDIRVRPFNVTGPGEPSRLVIASIARQVAEVEAGLRAPNLRLENLDTRRDFTDVRDVARGIVLGAQHGAPGEVFNICTGVLTSIRTVLSTLLTATSFGHVDIDEVTPARRPLVGFAGDSHRLSDRTGWRPRHALSDSVGVVLDEARSAVTAAASQDR